MLIYWIWFSCLTELSGKQKLALLEKFSAPEDIYRMDRLELRACMQEFEGMPEICNKDLTLAKQILQLCAEKGIGILTYADGAYPRRLKRIEDPPMVLYYRGRIPLWELRPTIGIVGTRSASTYGLRAARDMGRQIGACGGIVVSGGAVGIDSMALQGAIDADQQTVVIQAGGLDSLYPKSNEKLFAQVMENGCIFSEYPPGTSCRKWNFLRRNRIISGMSNGVLVVEAPKVSGALNTARWANEQGADVFVVPGNIGVESCAGSNALIGDIAHVALSGWAVMKEYAPFYPETVRKVDFSKAVSQIAEEETASAVSFDKKTVDKPAECPYSVKENIAQTLSEQEKTVVQTLGKTPVPADEVIDALGWSPAAVMTVLTKLSVKGVVQIHPGKLVSLK